MSMTLPPDLAYTMGGPFTPEQVELLTMPTTREREALWAYQFRELSDADRLHQLGFEDLDDLDAAGEDIPEEWERATVTYPTGRQLTAMWPVGQIEKEMAKYPGASARIH